MVAGVSGWQHKAEVLNISLQRGLRVNRKKSKQHDILSGNTHLLAQLVENILDKVVSGTP